MNLDKDNIMTMDSYMLLSVVNMKLRDEFLSLDDLCKTYDIEENKLKDKLKSIGVYYNKDTNQFI